MHSAPGPAIPGLPALLLAFVACSGAPRPCISPDDCSVGTECLANCCAVKGGLAVPEGLRRAQLAPVDVALVSASQHRASLPAALVVGGRSTGGVSLYLRFVLPAARIAHLERAFLRLEPMPGVAPSTERVPVRVWRVGRPWTSSDLEWLSQPPARSPGSGGLARTDPPQSLRIDVTELVRYLRDHPLDDHGMVLKADGHAQRGAAFATGSTTGRMPVLEVYFRPE
ncbi:MAG: DNRLRE domain-containing protein [Polyangiaceae bacterium]|nr:DNRLRE domain-containing protein [Polyangiaceae bacterium]